MKFVNLTPHDLNVKNAAGVVVLIPKSGNTARLQVSRTPQAHIGGFATAAPVFGEIEGLPAPEDGTTFVVSALVAERADRDDVVAPGELLRDEAGMVVGCNGFTRVAQRPPVFSGEQNF